MKEGLLRPLTALLAANVLMLALITYGSGGSYAFEGYYLGRQVYVYLPGRPAAAVALVEVALGAALAISAAVAPEQRLRRLLRASLLALIPLVMASGAAISEELLRGRLTIYGGKGDSYIIQVAAARLLLKGVNPYTVNYSQAVLAQAASYRLTFIYASGPPPYSANNIVGFVTSLDYPAFSFLYYVPAVLLHIPGNVWDSITLGAAMAVLYWRLRPGARPLFLAALAAGSFYFVVYPAFYYPISGWLAPLIVAVALYDSPPVAAALISLSASYRQFALGALVAYLAYAARRWGGRNFLEALAVSAAILAVVNLPFLLMNPGAFIHDVLLPGTVRLDREGLGLSSLQYFGLILPRYAQDAAVLAALAIGTYFASRPGSRWLWTLVTGVAFLLYPRPMYYYWLWFFYLGALAALVYEGDKLTAAETWWPSQAALAAGVVGVAAAVPAEAPGYVVAASAAALAAVVAVLVLPLIVRQLRPPALIPAPLMSALLVMGLAIVAVAAGPYVMHAREVLAVAGAHQLSVGAGLVGLGVIKGAAVEVYRSLPVLGSAVVATAIAACLACPRELPELWLAAVSPLLSVACCAIIAASMAEGLTVGIVLSAVSYMAWRRRLRPPNRRL